MIFFLKCVRYHMSRKTRRTPSFVRAVKRPKPALEIPQQNVIHVRIRGHDSGIQTIKDFMFQFEDRKNVVHQPILQIHGPSGVGKTMVCQWICQLFDYSLTFVDMLMSRSVFSSWDQTMNQIVSTHMFQNHGRKKAILFDDIDQFTPEMKKSIVAKLTFWQHKFIQRPGRIPIFFTTQFNAKWSQSLTPYMTSVGFSKLSLQHLRQICNDQKLRLPVSFLPMANGDARQLHVLDHMFRCDPNIQASSVADLGNHIFQVCKDLFQKKQKTSMHEIHILESWPMAFGIIHATYLHTCSKVLECSDILSICDFLPTNIATTLICHCIFWLSQKNNKLIKRPSEHYTFTHRPRHKRTNQQEFKSLTWQSSKFTFSIN